MISWGEFRHNLRTCFQDRMDGLCLVFLGVTMAALARSSLYWYFLNPKFSPVTLTAGVLLCVCGLLLLTWPQPGRATTGRLLRQAALLGFLSLAVTAVDQAARVPLPGVLNPATAENSANAPEAGDPDIPADLHPVRDGKEYLRLNLAELYIMLDKGRKDYPPRFALRAQVVRAPALEQSGHLLLKRTAVTCCLADSLELSFLAHGAESAFNGRQSGDWVEVFGSLEALHSKGEDKTLLQNVPKGEGPSIALTNPKFRILAETVEAIPGPSFPYLFEFREKEPYAW